MPEICDTLQPTLTGCWRTLMTMNIVDVEMLNVKFDDQRLNYMARYRGPGFTFLKLKEWAIKADHRSDIISAARILESFER